MPSKQERLKEVYEHLREYFGVHTQTDFAEKLRYSRNAISLALNGNEKYLTDKLFKNICEAFPNVFNLNYLLTGDGTLITTEEDVKDEDYKMIANADMIGTYLREIVKSKNETIATQKETIATLQREVDMLRREIDRLKSSEFSLVVADNTEPDK